MTEERQSEKQTEVIEAEEQAEMTDEAWREVGKQFEALGKSLSQAFRTTWESEETQRQVESIRDGLEKAAQQVEEAVKEAGASPEAQKLRGETKRAAESLQAAGEKAWQDARPHLLSALTQFNAELQKMVERLQQQEETSEEPPVEGEPDVTEE